MAFEEGGGCLTVEHEEHLVPESARQQIMVF
jgi:hypothetical protein